MTREEAARRNTTQNELKPCPCGNTVEVKYIAGIGESLLKYINNPFASLMPTYYINCDKCGRSMMVRLKKINSGASGQVQARSYQSMEQEVW